MGGASGPTVGTAASARRPSKGDAAQCGLPLLVLEDGEEEGVSPWSGDACSLEAWPRSAHGWEVSCIDEEREEEVEGERLTEEEEALLLAEESYFARAPPSVHNRQRGHGGRQPEAGQCRPRAARDALRGVRCAASELERVIAKELHAPTSDSAPGFGEDATSLWTAAGRAGASAEELAQHCGEAVKYLERALQQEQHRNVLLRRHVQTNAQRQRRQRLKERSRLIKMPFCSTSVCPTPHVCLEYAVGNKCPLNATKPITLFGRLERRCELSHICPFCRGAECRNRHGYLKEHLGLLKRPLWTESLQETARAPKRNGGSGRARASQLACKPLTEEETSMMNNLAKDLAHRLVRTDRSVDFLRLRVVLLTMSARLVRAVLCRLPYEVLRSLWVCAPAKMDLPYMNLREALTPEVLHSSLLLEDLRKRDAWLQRPIPVDWPSTVTAAAPLGAGLRAVLPLFGEGAPALCCAPPRSLDEEEAKHPRLEPTGWAHGRLQLVPNLVTFRLLLSLFTNGLSDVLPWDCGVVIGGSTCLACATLPESIATRYEKQLQRAVALIAGARTTRHALVTAMGGGPGCEQAVLEIMSFLRPLKAARSLLAPMARELYGYRSAYAGADLDLFVTASSKASAAHALEKTRAALLKAMTSRSQTTSTFYPEDFDDNAADTVLKRIASGVHPEPRLVDGLPYSRELLEKKLAGNFAPVTITHGPVSPVLVRTANSVTICGGHPYRPVQLVIRVAETVDEAVCFADIDCTAAHFDGRTLWAAPRFLRSLELGYNMVGPQQMKSPSGPAAWLPRMAKYARRGIGTLVYELCKHQPRCDVEIDELTRRRLDEAARMARIPELTTPVVCWTALATVEMTARSLVQREHSRTVSVWRRVNDGYDDDQAGDGHLPLGPPVSTAVIKAYLKIQADERAELQARVERRWGRLPNGRHGLDGHVEVANPTEGESWWLGMVKWRRERARELRRKFGLVESELCYMCGESTTREERGTGANIEAAADGTSCDCTEDRSPSRPGGTSSAPNAEVAAWTRFATRVLEASGRTTTVDKPRVPVCLVCTAANQRRREDRENLAGYTAVVTGGRCKVGYEASLMLLRCGAFVVTSTRFPLSAAQRFLQEPDADHWQHRLHIYGADFTSFPSLQGFIAQLAAYYKVDVLVNNAAQTIRRPPAYYRSLLDNEKELSGSSGHHGVVQSLVRVAGRDPWQIVAATMPQARLMARAFSSSCSASCCLAVPVARGSALAGPIGPPGLDEEVHSATVQEVAEAALLFPAGAEDEHGEQLDLRRRTSWNTSLARGGIEPQELLEVLAVNTAAPYLLLQGLLPSLLRPAADTGAQGRFVVNVSSAEGLFSNLGASAKGPEHPHSNMAKAALNMLTKTAASELASQGVYCVAVDPGWVSLMQPHTGNTAAAGDGGSLRRLPPLSAADGAARVVAPILDGVRALRHGDEPARGVLLRNFRPVSW